MSNRHLLNEAGVIFFAKNFETDLKFDLSHWV